MFAGFIRGGFILVIEVLQSEVAGLFWRRRQKITDDIEWNLFRTHLSGEFFGSGGDNRFHSFGTVRVHTSLARG